MGLGYGAFGVGFGIFGAMFFLVSALVIGMFIALLAKELRTWNRNNHSPRLTVQAIVVAKRENIVRHCHTNGGTMRGAHGFHTTTSTVYYATFQVESGDRMELSVSGAEYGMLAEGDSGRLTFQGTRYLSFERE